MANYIGEFLCKIDSKGRMLFPAGLKKQLEPVAQEVFVINRGFESHLVLWPMADWETETKKLNKLNLYKKKNREFVRKFHNGATQLNIDAIGRLLLPKRLLDYAGVKKELVIYAYGQRIELWGKTQYEEMLRDDEDNFADLAEEVMGNSEDDLDS